MRISTRHLGALALTIGLLHAGCGGAEGEVGDIATLPAGKAVDLARQSIRGKLTIFDFYADWCGPCRIVGPRLEDLAREHPDQVALRKVDVVNWESDTAVTQGIDFLPYLAVVSPEGEVLAEGDRSYELLQERFGLDLMAVLRGEMIL